MSAPLSSKDNDSLAQYFRAQGSVQIAFLFGSQARDGAGPLSDVDLAVLLDDTVDPKNYFNYKVEMTADLMGVLGRNNVDLVVLNQATPLLKYQVVRDGVVLFEKAGILTQDFVVLSLREFMDTKHLRDIAEYYLFKRINSNQFGRFIDGKEAHHDPART